RPRDLVNFLGRGRVDDDARVRQRVRPLAQLELRAAHLHPGPLGEVEYAVRAVEAVPQLVYFSAHRPGRGEAFVAGLVATRADGLLAGSEHPVAGLRDAVVAVAA